MKEIEIYTDGACSGNPGPGGWGVILRYKGVEKELNGGERLTTNNRMELTAVIEALKSLKGPCFVHLYTDSKYVMKGFTEWLPGWIERNWKTASKQPVLNVDLWQELSALAAMHTIDWNWVKGHAGHPENERVDKLAREFIENLNKN